MSVEDTYTLKRLLELWIATDGDLPDQRMHKALALVIETIDDSDPDRYNDKKDF